MDQKWLFVDKIDIVVKARRMYLQRPGMRLSVTHSAAHETAFEEFVLHEIYLGTGQGGAVGDVRSNASDHLVVGPEWIQRRKVLLDDVNVGRCISTLIVDQHGSMAASGLPVLTGSGV